MQISRVLETAKAVADETLAPNAEAVDREAVWPEEGVRRLLAAGLGGLVVPRRFGGLGLGLLGLTRVCEVLAAACSSTSMCFGMHAVGSAVIAAKATDDQQRRLLQPIVSGEHLTTLALSESGSGAHFYFPQTRADHVDGHYRLSGQKSFVTNGSHADSYVLSVVSADSDPALGEFSCVLVPATTEGLHWRQPWQGFGMRGNSSREVELRDVRVPQENLLGAEGDQIWYVFEVVAPYFLMAMTGTYLGIGARAVDLVIEHLGSRQHAHNYLSLGKREVLQHRLGSLWAQQERTRRLAYYAAAEIDQGNAEAIPALLSAKAEVADTCVAVVNEAMTLMGGRAYGENAVLTRLLRDARAAHVMAPTTDILRTWVGRSLLGEPLLDASAD